MDWRKILTRPRTTGLLDVTQEITSASSHTSGRLLLRRTEDEVTIIFDDLVVDRVGTSTLYRLPTGFYPFHVERAAWWRPNMAEAAAGGTVNISTSGYVVGYALQAGKPMTARVVFDCFQAWPPTYPGSEVKL